MELNQEMPTLQELAMSLNALMLAYKEFSMKMGSQTDDIESAVLKVVNLIEFRCALVAENENDETNAGLKGAGSE